MYRTCTSGIGRTRREDSGYSMRNAEKIPADAQEILAAYYGLITHIDNQLSRFLTAVEEFDLLNTLVREWPRRSAQGKHYLFTRLSLTKGSIKIPAFIFDPGNLIAGTKKAYTTREDSRRFPSLVELATGEKKLKQTVRRSPIIIRRICRLAKRIPRRT